MRDAEPGGMEWNPYNLDIVPHAQVKVGGNDNKGA